MTFFANAYYKILKLATMPSNFPVLTEKISGLSCEKIVYVFFVWSFWFDSLHPSQPLFSHVGTDLPGLNQY